MADDIMVWDLETVPELEGYARANNLVGKSAEDIRSAMGDDFPKLIYHSIVCIGALVASRTANTNGHWDRPTCAQARVPIDEIVSGSAMSLFQASQAASMMAS